MKRILFIASLPPPATGQSIVSEKIYSRLKSNFKFFLVDLRKDTFKQGITSASRILKILLTFIKIHNRKKNADIVYLIISQSITGNIRDLITLFICSKHNIVLHLHGGGIREQVYARSRILYLINKILLGNVKKIIVLGNSLKSNFENILPIKNVVVIKNFADNCFFISNELLQNKYAQTTLRIVYLSNMMKEKGYYLLYRAVVELHPFYKDRVQLHFIGKFDQSDEEKKFKKAINNERNIFFLGAVHGDNRAKYLKDAHVLCLPTYYPFEGQPLSILEAYASGCCVITTNQGGITDIFLDGINGFEVRKKSVFDIKQVIESIIDNGLGSLKKIAERNANYAKETFREDLFINNIENVFNSIS